MIDGETLALLQSRLARAAASVLEATRVAAFDPALAAGGAVGAAICLLDREPPRLVAVAEEGLLLAGPLAPGLAVALLPHLRGPGDVVAAGDPRLGLAPGEIAMLQGVYLDGEPVGVVLSLARHDALATTLVLTPLRLLAAGEPDPSLLALVAANSRRPAWLRGDLLAQAAGLAPAVLALERLARAGGLVEGSAHLAAAAERAARAVLRGCLESIPAYTPVAPAASGQPGAETPSRARRAGHPGQDAPGGLRPRGGPVQSATGEVRSASDRGESSSRPPRGSVTVVEPEEAPAPRLRLTLVPDDAGGLVLDFAGSDLYQPGTPALTAPRTVALARLAVAQALPEVPLGSGLLAVVEVRVPQGSVLDPGLPPEAGPLVPTGPGGALPGAGGAPGGDAALAQRLVDLTQRALARLTPARALAGHGDGGTLVVEAPDRPGRPGWRCRLPLGAGAGASVGADGLPSVPPALAAEPAPSIEAVEAAYPLRITRYALREGSAGPGRYRGGPGSEVEVELLPEGQSPGVTWRWEGPAGVAPPGILGGGAGAPGEARIEGGRLIVRTAGGGGYGNPYERAIRLVVEDVTAGVVSPAEAKRAYGVALRPRPAPAAQQAPAGGREEAGQPAGRTRTRAGIAREETGAGAGIAWDVDDERTYRIRNFVFTNLAVEDL